MTSVPLNPENSVIANVCTQEHSFYIHFKKMCLEWPGLVNGVFIGMGLGVQFSGPDERKFVQYEPRTNECYHCF